MGDVGCSGLWQDLSLGVSVLRHAMLMHVSRIGPASQLPTGYFPLVLFPKTMLAQNL